MFVTFPLIPTNLLENLTACSASSSVNSFSVFLLRPVDSLRIGSVEFDCYSLCKQQRAWLKAGKNTIESPWTACGAETLRSECFLCVFALQELANCKLSCGILRERSLVSSCGNTFAFAQSAEPHVQLFVYDLKLTHIQFFHPWTLHFCCNLFTRLHIAPHLLLRHDPLSSSTARNILKQLWLIIFQTWVLWSFVHFCHSHSASRLPLNKRRSL